MFPYHFLHEVVRTNSNKIVLLDVALTPDCGWEGAYSIFDEDSFLRAWDEDGNESYDFSDIASCGEDMGAFDYWEVVCSHCRSGEAAEKKLRKYIATL